MSDESLPCWHVEFEESVLKTPIFEIFRVGARSALSAEKAGEFAVARCPDWVNVVAVTDDEEIVFVEQYRHGCRSLTLEIPGGMVDAGEDMVTAGLRELAEETGFTGEGAELIGVVMPNPAFQTNRCGTVLVRGVRRTQEPNLDPMEEIRVLTFSREEISTRISKGEIHHALVVAAFHHLTAWEALRRS